MNASSDVAITKDGWVMNIVRKWGVRVRENLHLHSSALPGQGRVNGITPANSWTLTPRFRTMVMNYYEGSARLTKCARTTSKSANRLNL